MAQNEPANPVSHFCKECLRARGFLIALGAIVISGLVVFAFVTNTEIFGSDIYYLFALFWGAIGALIVSLGCGCHYVLKRYCDPSMIDSSDGVEYVFHYYKSPWSAGFFGLLVVLIIIAITLSVQHFDGNYQYWIVDMYRDYEKDVIQKDGSMTTFSVKCANYFFSDDKCQQVLIKSEPINCNELKTFAELQEKWGGGWSEETWDRIHAYYNNCQGK